MKNISANNIKTWLLTGASVTALVAASSAIAPAHASEPAAQLAGTFFSLEGGGACAFGDNDTGPSLGPFPLPTGALTNNRTDIVLGNDDCGLTGRVGFGQEGRSLLGGRLNYWGIFARHMFLNDEISRGTWTTDSTLNGNLYPNYTGPVSGTSDERRTVIDFEVGRDIGVGMAGASARIIGGIRYAKFDANHRLGGRLTTGYLFYQLDLDTEENFSGVGPRIGAEFSMPVTSGIGFTMTGSASILNGKRRTRTVSTVFNAFSNATTVGVLSSSSTDWVANVEGEAALTLQDAGRGEVAIGLRGEAWFDQSRGPDGRNRDRHNWGPFIRLKFQIHGP